MPDSRGITMEGALSHGDRLLRLSEVAAVTATGERTIQRWVEAGRFPAPIRRPNWVRWRARDVAAWMDRAQGVA